MKNLFKSLCVILGATVLFSGCAKAKKGDEKVVLRMGFQAGSQSKEYMAAQQFAKDVAEASGGNVEIKIFAGGQLGDDRSMLEQTAAGALDITFAETGRFGLWINEAEIFGYPFAFDTYEHLARTVSSEYGKKIRQKILQKGWRILANGYNGTRQITSNKAISSISDMRSLKLRVPNAEANLNFAKYSGAVPTPMAFAEVYLALKTNVVDAQENPLSTVEAQKFYEVQKYCALTSHIINDNNYVISEIIYKNLSDAHKKILEEAALKASEYQTSLFKEDEERLISMFEKKGMTITSPDRTPFKEAHKVIFDEYVKKYGNEAINAIEAAR